MSILQGFAMLNNSIRQIRVDRNQHEQRMANLELEKNKLSAQQNDPRLQLDKLKATKEMELVPVNYQIGKFDNDKDRQYFNRYTKGAVDAVLLDDGLALSPNGGVVFAGTNKEAKIPRYQQRTLANKLSLATMATKLGHTELDMEIDLLNEDITQTKKEYNSVGVAKQKMFNESLKRKESKYAELVAQRDDPTKSLERLMGANKTINEMYIAALSDPNIDDKFYSRLNDVRTANTNEIKALASQNGDLGKNLMEVEYTKVLKDGSLSERSVVMSKFEANKAPNQLDFGDGIYTLGKRSNLSKPDGDGSGKLAGGITLQAAQSINRNTTKAKNIISAARQKDMGEEHIKSILASGGTMEAAEIDDMMRLIQSDAKAVIADWQKTLETDRRNYGKYSWFVDKDTPGQDTNDSSSSFKSGQALDILQKQLEANRKK